MLEAAHDRLEQLLGLRPPRPIRVVVYDPAVFDAEFARFFRFAAAGFYGGDIRIRGDTRVTAPLERVLHHELVHAGFDAAAPSLVLPGWVNEGLAEWFEARATGKRLLGPGERASLERASRAGGLLPLATLSAPSFARLGPDAAALAYLQSYALVEHLAWRRGAADVRRFATELVRSRSVERSLQRCCRMDPAELERDFLDSLR